MASTVPVLLLGSPSVGPAVASPLPQAVLTGAMPANGPGQVGAFGAAQNLGGPGTATARPLVGVAATPSGNGYWLAAADGGVFSYGDAIFHGSAGNQHLTSPVVGIAPTPTGNGYWLAAADGGVFSYGDAQYAGSMDPMPAGTMTVGIASPPGVQGYWLPTAPTPPPPPAASVHAASTSTHGASLGTFEITCYDLQGRTATGTETNSETVAVDPSVIPLGSHIWIDGVGERTAEDTGGAIRGHRLDIWEPTYADCQAWGVQNRTVYQG